MSPPYQVTEMGWGEFEAGIKIFWKNGSKAVTSFVHALKLYEQISQPTPFNQSTNTEHQPQPDPVNVDKPVISEFYDEVVFTFKNPSDDPFYDALTTFASDMTNMTTEAQSIESVTEDSISGDGNAEMVGTTQLNKPLWPKTYWTDSDQVQVITCAQNYVDTELNAVKDRILKAESEALELERLQKELAFTKAAAKATSSNKGIITTTVTSR